MSLQGIFPALMSPFNSDHSYNWDHLRLVVRRLKSKNVHGFYVGGSSAELMSLTIEERTRAVEVVKEEAGDRLVIVHVGAMNPFDAQKLARHARECECDAISAIPPFYGKYSWREISAYYRSLMDASGLKFLLYNIPAFTGVSLQADQYRELLSTGMVAGVKHTSKDLFELERLKSTHPDGVLLSGYDELFCGAQVMGADGCIGSSVNAFPEYYQTIDAHLKSGNNTAAYRVQKELNSLLEVLAKVGFFPALKHLLCFLDMPVGNCRPPFLEITAEQKKGVEKAYLQCDANMKLLAKGKDA